MPSINQLVRKGRSKPKKKVSTPGLKSGQGRKKRIAAPAARRVHARLYDHAEEAELGAAQGRACGSPTAWRSPPTSRARATTCRSTRSCSCAAAAKDLPGVRYKVVRGTLDAAGVSDREGPLAVRAKAR